AVRPEICFFYFLVSCGGSPERPRVALPQPEWLASYWMQWKSLPPLSLCSGGYDHSSKWQPLADHGGRCEVPVLVRFLIGSPLPNATSYRARASFCSNANCCHAFKHREMPHCEGKIAPHHAQERRHSLKFKLSRDARANLVTSAFSGLC